MRVESGISDGDDLQVGTAQVVRQSNKLYQQRLMNDMSSHISHAPKGCKPLHVLRSI